MRPIKQEYYPKIEQFINEYHAFYGVAPSIRAIAAMLHVSGPTAWRYVQRMHEEGLLEYNGGYGRITTSAQKKTGGQTERIPTVGSISCGLPKLAEEDIEEYISLPTSWVGSGKIFALRADGHSMINAGIDTGDYILIRQQDTAEPGQIIVALVDNEAATLKRYRPHPERGIVELVPENDAFCVQVVDLKRQTLIIQGVVVGVYKSYDVRQSS